MDTSKSKRESERIVFQISKEERELFDLARNLMGLTSLSEFARRAIKKEAIAIVQAEQRILISKRDKDIFFNALMGIESAPNESLKEAIQHYKSLIAGQQPNVHDDA